MTTYVALDELKAAFAAHASHCELQFTGSPAIHVIAINRGITPIAVLRLNAPGPDEAPPPHGSPAIWRLHSPATGAVYCEGIAVAVAQYIARGDLLPQS